MFKTLTLASVIAFAEAISLDQCCCTTCTTCEDPNEDEHLTGESDCTKKTDDLWEFYELDSEETCYVGGAEESLDFAFSNG